MDKQTLWDIEEGFWLKGRKHFAAHLHPDCVFALPEPAGIIGGDGFVEHLPEDGVFSNVEMTERSFSAPTKTLRVLVYKAHGTLRSGGSRSALCSTTFVFEGERALLVQHQQTPL